MSMLMLFAWQSTNDVKYQAPFNRCVEATYADSTLKAYVESANAMARDKAPMLYAIGIPAYGIGIRKQLNFKSSKITLAPGAVTSYSYDERTKAGNITLTFAF